MERAKQRLSVRSSLLTLVIILLLRSLLNFQRITPGSNHHGNPGRSHSLEAFAFPDILGYKMSVAVGSGFIGPWLGCSVGKIRCLMIVAGAALGCTNRGWAKDEDVSSRGKNCAPHHRGRLLRRPPHHDDGYAVVHRRPLPIIARLQVQAPESDAPHRRPMVGGR